MNCIAEHHPAWVRCLRVWSVPAQGPVLQGQADSKNQAWRRRSPVFVCTERSMSSVIGMQYDELHSRVTLNLLPG